MNTAAGTLSAAIVAGLLVIVMKMFDHFSNKTVRDYKDLLEFKKNSSNLTKFEIKEIDYFIGLKEEDFLNIHREQTYIKESSWKLDDLLFFSKMIGAGFLFVTVSLLLIGEVLFRSKMIGDKVDFLNFGITTGMLAIFFISAFIILDINIRENTKKMVDRAKELSKDHK